VSQFLVFTGSLAHWSTGSPPYGLPLHNIPILVCIIESAKGLNMKSRFIIIFLALAFISACSSVDKIREKFESSKNSSAMVGAAVEGEQSVSPNSAIPDRKIIHTIHLSLEVDDIQTAAEGIQKMAADINGFVVDLRSYEDDAGRRTMSLKLKVPASEIENTCAMIKELGHIREENVSGEDVTEQYVDLEARLQNAKRLEDRILKLLDQKSESLKDILDVERELSKVRERIETMEGRKHFMDDRIRLATISIELSEPPGFGRGIFDPLYGLLNRALSMFTASIAVLVVVTSAAVPWIALLILLAWLLLQFLRFWIRRKREAKAQRRKEENG